jgi:hypothetical protein
MLCGHRRDFGLCEITRGLLDQLLFFSQCEVHDLPLLVVAAASIRRRTVFGLV